MEVWGRAPSGAQEQSPWWRSGVPPGSDDTFVKVCYFVNVDKAIFAFIAYKSSTWNESKLNLEAEKWYSKLQRLPIRHEKNGGGRLSVLPNRQCTDISHIFWFSHLSLTHCLLLYTLMCITRKPSLDVALTNLAQRTLESKKTEHSSSCDCDLWPMTFIFELDLDTIKIRQHARYLDQRSYSSELIFRT